MKKMMKKGFGFLLTLALLLGMLPGMSLTAKADDAPPYAQYMNTTTVIKFDEKDWYLINYDANTVTLLAKKCVGASKYDKSGIFVEYSNDPPPTVKTAVDDWYRDNITADAKTAVSGSGMFLLTTSQANALSTDVLKCSQASGAESNGWWLCSQGSIVYYAAFVYGYDGDVYGGGIAVSFTVGVRPALKLNLSSVIFSSESKTFFTQKQTITADDVTVSYGDTGKSVSASVTDPATGGGAISYAVKTGSEDYIDVDATTGALTIKKAGTAIVVVTAAETDTYAQATKDVTVTISKGEGGGTPSANTLVYSGSAQELVTAGKAEGGTMYYALGEDETTAPAFYLDEAKTQIDTSKWSTSLPKGTNAGTYYVWYIVKGDENHNDSEPKCVESTIAKRDLTVTADAKSKTQGEADPALTYTASGLVGTDVMSGALSREAGEDPGTYQITQGTLTAGDNYAIAYTPAVLTINKAVDPEPEPSPEPAPSGGGTYYGVATVQNRPREPFSDVIGACVTRCQGSSPERIHNIELACEKLNGIVLQPGEVFSFHEAVGPFTAEAGFVLAPVDPEDETTAVMGGGISQVASTLYAGSLFSLLETVERTNHPFPVSFTQPGTDALVSSADNGGLDLKFRSTRTEPIRIVAACKVDAATNIPEIRIGIQSALTASDYMPILFDNTWAGDRNAFLTETPYDPTRPGYRILLTHEEQAFTDDHGAGIRTLTHRKILDAAGMLVRDEILNSRLPDGSYAMDTYYLG